MVADDQAPGAARPVVDADLLQRLRDCYETFMEAEPRILRRKTNRRLSYQACQDVAHEAYLKVARKAMSSQLGPEVQLAAYLRRTSRNLAIDTLRAQERLEPLDDTGLVPSVPNQRQPADDFDPLEELVVPTIDAMPLSRLSRRSLQRRGITTAVSGAVISKAVISCKGPGLETTRPAAPCRAVMVPVYGAGGRRARSAVMASIG
ncbi:RNA polymerase sigma factor [Streptomyces sp. NPDC004266]|uniref:RNA polymerase sigma factor n=1 Tax=Streptomyces sp. NPDC004266 TaxID=3364693 RepID=UPI0036B23D86